MSTTATEMDVRFEALGAAMFLAVAAITPALAQTGSASTDLGPGTDMDTKVGRPPLTTGARPQPTASPDAPSYAASSGLSRSRGTAPSTLDDGGKAASRNGFGRDP